MDKEYLIRVQEDIIKESQNNLKIIRKVEDDKVYLIHKTGTSKAVVRIESISGSTPEIRGVLLAHSSKDGLLTDPYDYSLWMKFIEDLEPFNLEDAPKCINWEYITPEFKKMYFNQGD